MKELELPLLGDFKSEWQPRRLSRHIKNTIDQIQSLLKNQPASALVLFRSIQAELKNENKEEYKNVNDAITKQLDRISKSHFETPRDKYFHYLDNETRKLLLNNIWEIIFDYLPTYSVLHDAQGNKKNLVIIDHPTLPEIAVEDSIVRNLVQQGLLDHYGITQDDIEEKLIPMTLTRHIHLRMKLGRNWYFLPTSVDEIPEEKQEECLLITSEERKQELALHLNTKEIFSALEKEAKCSLAIKITQALQSATQKQEVSINLHPLLETEVQIWRLQLGEDPFPTIAVAALSRGDKIFLLLDRIRCFLLVGGQSFMMLYATHSSDTFYSAAISLSGYIWMQHFIIRELTESQYFRFNNKKFPIVFLMVIGIFYGIAPMSQYTTSYTFESGLIHAILNYFIEVCKYLLIWPSSLVLIKQTQKLFFDDPRAISASLLSMMTFITPAIFIEGLVNYPQVKENIEQTYSPYISIPFALFNGIANLIPDIIASHQSAQEFKTLIKKDRPRTIMNEWYGVTYTRYAATFMAMTFCAISMYGQSNAKDGGIQALLVMAAALAMLNRSFIPKAIRTASLKPISQLPQIFMPAPRVAAEAKEEKTAVISPSTSPQI